MATSTGNLLGSLASFATGPWGAVAGSLLGSLFGNDNPQNDLLKEQTNMARLQNAQASAYLPMANRNEALLASGRIPTAYDAFFNQRSDRLQETKANALQDWRANFGGGAADSSFGRQSLQSLLRSLSDMESEAGLQDLMMRLGLSTTANANLANRLTGAQNNAMATLGSVASQYGAQPDPMESLMLILQAMGKYGALNQTPATTGAPDMGAGAGWSVNPGTFQVKPFPPINQPTKPSWTNTFNPVMPRRY